MNEPDIPPRFLKRIQEFIAAVRAGQWAGGGQVCLKVSKQGVVTAVEVQGRDENR